MNVISVGEATMTKDADYKDLLVEFLEDLPFDGMVVHDHGTILEVNDQFCTLFGLTEDKVIGQNIFELGLFMSEAMATVQAKVKAGFEGLYQARGRHTNGSVIPIEIYVKQVKHKGKAVRVAAVRDLTSIYRAESNIAESGAHLRNAFVNTVRVLSSTLEKRDPYTAGHQSKVASLSVAIGRRMGMDEEAVFGLEMGSLVHDLGKIAIPAELLSKPSRLSTAEFNLIKTHSLQGFEILLGLGLPWDIERMAREHHERIDGSGYPDGIANGEICDSAKIIGVADMVEAISAHRPYRAALGMQVALTEVNKLKGKKLDKDVVRACTACILEDDFAF